MGFSSKFFFRALGLQIMPIQSSVKHLLILASTFPFIFVINTDVQLDVIFQKSNKF